MSTPLLDPFRFANLRASLLHHATNELSPGSCSSINGEIFRACELDPWGRASTDHGAPANLAAARIGVQTAINLLIFDWQRANWAAHVVRYHDQADGWKGEQPEKPSPRLPRGEVLSVPALLKALRALRYNVDGGQASGPIVQRSLATLDRLIDAMKDHCLELLAEYRDAEWAI